MGGIFRKIKRRLGKTQKWVMGEKIVFDEGKQRVKQQENVDIQSVDQHIIICHFQKNK